MSTVCAGARSVAVTLITGIANKCGSPGRGEGRRATFAILVTSVGAAGAGRTAGVINPRQQFTAAAVDVIGNGGRMTLTATEVVRGATGVIGGITVAGRRRAGVNVAAVRTTDAAAIIGIPRVRHTVTVITGQSPACRPVGAGVGDVTAVGTGLGAADVSQDIINHLVFMRCVSAGCSIGTVTVGTVDGVRAAEVLGMLGGGRSGR